jgi:hypothetical protein
MAKYLRISSYIRKLFFILYDLQPIPSEFLISEENFVFFFISVTARQATLHGWRAGTTTLYWSWLYPPSQGSVISATAQCTCNVNGVVYTYWSLIAVRQWDDSLGILRRRDRLPEQGKKRWITFQSTAKITITSHLPPSESKNSDFKKVRYKKSQSIFYF